MIDKSSTLLVAIAPDPQCTPALKILFSIRPKLEKKQMCQTKTNDVRFCDYSQTSPSDARSSWLLRPPHPAAVDTGVLQLNFHRGRLHLTNLITWLITCLWDHMSKYSSASSADASHLIYLNSAFLLPCWHGLGSEPSFLALTLTDSENKTCWSELEEVEEEGCPVPPFLTEVPTQNNAHFKVFSAYFYEWRHLKLLLGTSLLLQIYFHGINLSSDPYNILDSTVRQALIRSGGSRSPSAT